MANNKDYNRKVDIVAYSESDQMRDEKIFDKSIESNILDYSSFRRLMIKDLCMNSEIIETGYIGDVRLDDARDALKNPHSGWKTLMRVSEQLMMVSPHYFRLNSLYSNMALFCWGIDLYDVSENYNITTLKKKYNALAARLENMNLKHELSKIMKYLPYQDVYCGLVVENDESFFFQKIDYRICKLHQVQDGLYNFKINLGAINTKELNAYPDYVQDAYIDFVEGNQKCNWYMPPPEKQICVKLNSQWTTPYPILIGLIKDILDLDVYKRLKMQSARTDNYKAIMIQVPIDQSTVDKPLLTPETLSIFADINRENMSDDIGMIHTLGSDAEPISFKDSANTRNNVSDAVDELYNSSGLSQELFNGSSSGTAVTFSVENDSGFVYGVYRQFERWVNRYIRLNKFNVSKFKFSFYLVDITVFNRDNVTKRYKEACTLGVPVVDKLLATLDMTPSRTMGSYIVHNDIFDYYNRFKPLSSSYNASGDIQKEAGRPTNAENGELLDVEGERTADGEKNDR